MMKFFIILAIFAAAVLGGPNEEKDADVPSSRVKRQFRGGGCTGRRCGRKKRNVEVLAEDLIAKVLGAPGVEVLAEDLNSKDADVPSSRVKRQFETRGGGGGCTGRRCGRKKRNVEVLAEDLRAKDADVPSSRVKRQFETR